ncbi:uncharacterized protein LOC100194197 [Zea mays]|uniref:Uncharacterized protein n=2 Tax=Zea mays TaxID=4577 RepID=B4FHT0_MAIZE|nr:uncharacterized protein LOC100194197 [Zea mays]ACF81673.1 unknown [Zea mays]AQK53048.1 hypothetical protein ZEAMMB73_Zm00001d050785 [Zea mays]|eukprot:NP_001132714.1 uncharacterized protein LOC100194197 [Zea mays]
MAMEDAASESSDWEVLSATSACGGGDDDEVLIVSGGGGDVVLDHFALTPDTAAAWPGDGEGSWSDDRGAWQGLELLDGFDPIPEASFNLAAGVWNQPLLISGVDDAREGARSATRSADGNQEEVVAAEIQQESNSVFSRGELRPVLQPAYHGVGETLDSDAATRTGASLQGEVSESSLVRLDGGIGTGVERSCLEDAVSSDEIHGEQEEQEQGSKVNAATGCDEPDGEVKDGALPLAHTAGTEEGEKQFVVWWKLPFKLLHYCAWKVKPVWSFSIAAALLGLVVLGRRMYRMKRKARGLPQIKIAFDDKRASQFADRAAYLKEAFLVARRVPMLRTSSGATLPWSMVQER